MADYGIKIVNDQGNIQIDSTYKNMYLHSKILYSAGTTVNNVPNNPITVSGTQAIKKFSVPKTSFGGGIAVAVSVHDGYNTCFAGIFENDNNYDIYIYICSYLNDSGTGNYQPSNATIYIFGTFPDTSMSSGSYGLVVKNKEGKVVFDSNYNPLKIVDTLTTKVGAGGQYYYYDGSLDNKALLFQGIQATLDLNYVVYQEDNYSEVDDAYQVKGYYGFQNNKILGTLNGDAIDSNNFLMDYLQSRRTFNGGGNPPSGQSYYINAPLPLVIDTSRY